MVANKVNISAYSGIAPTTNSSTRLIEGGPLYAKQEILQLLATSKEAVMPWTKKSIQDIQQLELDSKDLTELVIDALSIGSFRNSEWCQQSPQGPWAACDAYQFQRIEWVAAAYKEMQFEYYIKFALAKTGKLLLLVSCHLSQDRS